MNNLRKVQVYKWVKATIEGKSQIVQAETVKGKFHQWGVNFEEFESGPANYTVAIVELDDGSVEMVPANLIRFFNE